MCRMLAIIPTNGSFVDSSYVREFRKLASCGKVKDASDPGHPDGWGMVAWKEKKPFYLARRPKDAWEDPEYEKVCDKIDAAQITSPLIVHFRKASLGAITEENTHPFVIGDWAFAHNGTIRNQNLKDRTDSEWFFGEILRERELSKSNMPEAIRREVDSVREVYDYSSLTFLLSDGREFYAYRDAPKDLWYYTLFYTTVDDAIILCQEKYFESKWKELGNGELLSIADGLRVSNLGSQDSRSLQNSVSVA